MSKRILITGGAGFVGSHLADALLRRGHQVRVLDNLTPQVHHEGWPSYLSKGLELVRGDMRNLDDVRRALSGVEAIFHLAAAVGVGQSMYEISHYMGSNTQGTANLLQAILDTKMKVAKLVVASSMSIYGEGKYFCSECGEVAPAPRATSQLKSKHWEMQCPVCRRVMQPIATDESKPLQCTSIYALSKKDQEEMTLLFGRAYGIPVVGLRYFNIYGTRQALSNPYTGVAAIFASRLLNRKAPVIFEDGQQMRDFVSVHDVVQANLLAMATSGADGKAINIGSGNPVTIREVGFELGRALGLQLPGEITGKYRAGDVRHCFADITAATQLLAYSPKVTLREGMEELAEWLESQQADDNVDRAL